MGVCVALLVGVTSTINSVERILFVNGTMVKLLTKGTAFIKADKRQRNSVSAWICDKMNSILARKLSAKVAVFRCVYSVKIDCIYRCIWSADWRQNGLCYSVGISCTMNLIVCAY